MDHVKGVEGPRDGRAIVDGMCREQSVNILRVFIRALLYGLRWSVTKV